MGVSLWQAVQNCGWVVPETARGLGAAFLCAQPAGTCWGSSSSNLEMPAGRGARDSGHSGDSPNCGSRVVFNTTTLKTALRDRDNCVSSIYQAGFFEESFKSQTL